MELEYLDHLDGYIAVKRYRLVNAVLVYENGLLVFERYYNKFTPGTRSHLKSVWKSVLSLTLGVCIDKGFIKSVGEPVGRYLPEFDGGIDPYHKMMTTWHLLTMSSGVYWRGGVHYHCPMMDQMRRSSDWVPFIANVKMSEPPGSRFVYKEWDVILLSALIQKACGGFAFDICDEYIYKPLGISSGRWPASPCGVEYNATGGEEGEKGSDLCARDLAKIGLLMLNGGAWEGERVISDEYVQASVTPSFANEGYGYLWWLTRVAGPADNPFSLLPKAENNPSSELPKAAGAFHGRGFGGQELNVYPREKTVIVVQATATPSGKSYGDIAEGVINSDRRFRNPFSIF